MLFLFIVIVIIGIVLSIVVWSFNDQTKHKDDPTKGIMFVFAVLAVICFFLSGSCENKLKESNRDFDYYSYQSKNAGRTYKYEYAQDLLENDARHASNQKDKYGFLIIAYKVLAGIYVLIIPIVLINKHKKRKKKKTP